MKFCPKCGAIVDEFITVCPACGTNLEDNPAEAAIPKKKKAPAVAIVAGVLAFILLFVAFILNYSKKSSSDDQSDHSNQLTEKNTSYNSSSSETTKNTSTKDTSSSTVKNSDWTLEYYVDEFKNPTGKAFICSKELTGTFSNSATTNSKLTSLILIDKDSVSIMLWEYNRSKVKAYSNDAYEITVLDDQGKKHNLTGTMYKNGDRITLRGFGLIDLLLSNKELSIYIAEDSKYGVNSSYLFTVSSSNFSSLYSQSYSTVFGK